MDKELIEKLKDSMECSGKPENLVDKKMFSEIATEAVATEADKKDGIAFVDGGSAEIFSSASFCFGIIRTAFTAFSADGKKSRRILESYIIAKPAGGKNLRYSAEIFEEKGRLFESLNFEFDPSEDSLKSGGKNMELKGAIGLIRRIAEIRTAVQALEEGCRIIVLDGSLDCASGIEKRDMKKLFSISDEKSACICALSKTSELVDANGNSISLKLSRSSPYKKWFCRTDSIESSEKEKSLPSITTFFAKLNSNSKHAFRVDVRNSEISHEKIFSLLAENSRDASFPGYPYGLIEADSIARISRNEQEYLRNLFAAKIGKMDIEYYTSSLNAHGILDRMSF